tara:strand:+ start:206 stop:382 length:177 start_codon:yes stop_codon:yes gene_type:complete
MVQKNFEVGEMVAPSLAGRKVRTPQDKAPLKRRASAYYEWKTASATESKHPNFMLGNR